MKRPCRAGDFAFRCLYDARSPLTMIAQGVTEFATVSVKDFDGLGFRRVWNPLGGLNREPCFESNFANGRVDPVTAHTLSSLHAAARRH